MTQSLPTSSDITGSTSWRWFRGGYVEALQDVLDAAERGGLDEVVEWCKNNK